MTLAAEEDNLWQALGEDLESLESILAPDTSQQCCHVSLVGGEDLDVLLTKDTVDARWLADGLAPGTEDLPPAQGLFQPSTVHVSPPSKLPTLLHPGQPLVPAAGSIALPGGLTSSACAGLAGGAGLEIAALEAGGRALLGETFYVPLQSTHNSLHQQQQRQQQGQSQRQQQQPRKLQAGAIPGQPKRRGRPPTDRSQMTEKQLKAISITQAHLERKKNHLRDLEERMADVRAELEREKAQQESNMQAVAALEQLLHYTEDMVAILRQGQGTSVPELLHSSPAASVEEAVAGSSSSSGSFAATCEWPGTGPLLTSASAEQQEPDQPDWPLEAPTSLEDLGSFHSGGAAAAAGTQASSIQLLFRQWRLQLEKMQQMPCNIPSKPMPEPLDIWRVWAAASPDVVAELQSVNPGDMIQGWRDVARRSRDAVAVYDVMKSEAWAVSRLGPLHQLGILPAMDTRVHSKAYKYLINGLWVVALQGIMMKLATIHNPACMRHMLLASADNLSEEQRREKYDALVAAMDITPSQQERYLELANAYTSFVQQARQHKADALARIAQSAFSSMPASASAGRMVSRYLEALDAASTLSTYPDAELVAAVELMSGIGTITKPLQKVKAAAMAYPDLVDIVQVVEAIKRLPPPEQRRQQRWET